MRLVHLGTVIQTQFGALDDDDNVVPQEPVTANVQVFTAEAFAEAFARIKGARDATDELSSD